MLILFKFNRVTLTICWWHFMLFVYEFICHYELPNYFSIFIHKILLQSVSFINSFLFVLLSRKFCQIYLGSPLESIRLFVCAIQRNMNDGKLWSLLKEIPITLPEWVIDLIGSFSKIGLITLYLYFEEFSMKYRFLKLSSYWLYFQIYQMFLPY